MVDCGGRGGRAAGVDNQPRGCGDCKAKEPLNGWSVLVGQEGYVGECGSILRAELMRDLCAARDTPQEQSRPLLSA